MEAHPRAKRECELHGAHSPPGGLLVVVAAPQNFFLPSLHVGSGSGRSDGPAVAAPRTPGAVDAGVWRRCSPVHSSVRGGECKDVQNSLSRMGRRVHSARLTCGSSSGADGWSRNAERSRGTTEERRPNKLCEKSSSWWDYASPSCVSTPLLAISRFSSC